MGKSKKNWVDFKAIKQQVGMEAVLLHYGIFGELKESGKNMVGYCPIHKGSNKRQFSVHLEKNIFNCFGSCKTGGNVLDFVAMMEFGNKDIEKIRQASLLIKEWFDINESDDRTEQGSDQKQPVREEKQEQKKSINPALTFQLKNLETEHPFFKERGIEPTTIKHFGLGYCSKGVMRGRIAIPIQDGQGNLVAYCGRAIDDEQIEKSGKYKMPAKFIKSAVVYNLNRQKGVDTLILVESFLSVFWLYQNGVENVIALMGSKMSSQQERMIVITLGKQGKIILMFDGDEDGSNCSDDCLARFSPNIFVKIADISPYGKKPHQLDPEIIRNFI
ncbi:MAG: CHC2 zinc finger domain-containing protein [Nitrospinota bacterium]